MSDPDPSFVAKMSSQPNTPYFPVDSGDGHQGGHLDDQSGTYRDNPSPVPPDHPRDPSFKADSFSEEGVARPRFLGHSAGGEARASFASSFGVPSFNETDNSSSVYALNPLGPTRDSGVGYASVPHQDDPHDSDFVTGAASTGRRSR